VEAAIEAWYRGSTSESKPQIRHWDQQSGDAQCDEESDSVAVRVLGCNGVFWAGEKWPAS